MTGAAVLVLDGLVLDRPVPGERVMNGAHRHGPAGRAVPVAGVPMLARTVAWLADSPRCDQVIVLVPESDVEPTRRLLAHPPTAVSVCPVERGAPASLSGTVVVHEMTRPLAPARLLATVLDAAGERDGVVVPVLPVSDTIKRVDPDGRVLATQDRAGLRRVQTPLALPARLLAGLPSEALAGAAALLGHLCSAGPVHTVPGDPLAFAIHSEWDLRVAESLLGT